MTDEEEECSVPTDASDDRVSTTAKFVNFKATGKERWTEALPCMLCCFSAARQQCCHRASCASRRAARRKQREMECKNQPLEH
jgi:hypothetical protein